MDLFVLLREPRHIVPEDFGDPLFLSPGNFGIVDDVIGTLGDQGEIFLPGPLIHRKHVHHELVHDDFQVGGIVLEMERACSQEEGKCGL